MQLATSSVLRSSMRHDIADGLKVLALLGVFMVNGLGYALAPYYPLQLGAPFPIDSALAQAVHTLVLTLFMGKALPFLAFLFGYSMALYAKRSADPKSLKRRQWKLLLVGLLHGTLIYFGDILTAYALMGLWMANSTRLRGRYLLRRWCTWAIISTVVMAYWLWLISRDFQPTVDYDITTLAPAFGQMQTFMQIFALNSTSFLTQIIGWLLASAPLHLCLFITGSIAARYRWLSANPKLPQLFLRPWLYRSWPLALLANALLALAALYQQRLYGANANLNWIVIVNVPLGVWLAASGLTRFMRHIQTEQSIPHWLAWLAPAGRHTLAMYLGLSITLLICGRLGLFASQAAWNHTAVWALALLLLWLLAVCLGRTATAQRLRGPISRWLSS